MFVGISVSSSVLPFAVYIRRYLFVPFVFASVHPFTFFVYLIFVGTSVSSSVFYLVAGYLRVRSRRGSGGTDEETGGGSETNQEALGVRHEGHI